MLHGTMASVLAASTLAPPVRPTIALDPGLRIRLTDLAAGRSLVVDYFASARCGPMVGDLTADLVPGDPGPEYMPLRRLAGVPCYVAGGLVPLLESADVTIRFGGLPFARHLAVTVEPPEAWIDFLERSCATRGRRRRS